MIRLKRTKIVATIGPASGSREQIESLIEAGVDVFRINFSHGDPEQRQEYLDNIRAVERELGRPTAICGDLCGPKIRVGMIEDGPVTLEQGNELVIQREPVDGTAERISTTFQELVDHVSLGERILLADGHLQLEVTGARPPDEFTCKVVRGGPLSSGKGVNLPDTEIPISPLTEKDREDVEWIGARDFDYVALSFVQRAEDVLELRRLLREAGSQAHIIAKIEKPQALRQIDEIVEATDAVMVARGDLGVEMALPAVPIAQKSITRRCETAGKTCIIATEMLESMIHSAVPTRAEVSDVANAVFDHTDAVMLSAESSIGQYPVQAVRLMRDVVVAVQDFLQDDGQPPRVPFSEPAVAAAIAGAIRHVMKMQKITAIVVYTASGTTARLIAKNRPPCPILALSAEKRVVRRCRLYYGVEAKRIGQPADITQLLDLATVFCKEMNIAARGDDIILIAGHPLGVQDRTNGLVVETLE
jgi:pyruvate kinase